MLTIATSLVPSLNIVPGGRPAVVSRAGAVSMKVGLVYSTSTGNTETVAGYIKDVCGDAVEGPNDIGDVSGDIAGYDGLIVGAPTWNTNADSERSGTEWDEFLYGDLTGMDLKGKKVAIFGLGDQSGYGDNFCDAMGELYDLFTAQGATVVGATATDGYEHSDTKSIRDGKFVGMPFDEDNQYDMSEDRAKSWVEQLKGEGMAL